MGSAGFGQSEAGNLSNYPEGGWFLRYIRQQTVGSFSEGSLEPLLERAGLKNLAHLKRKSAKTVEYILLYKAICECK